MEVTYNKKKTTAVANVKPGSLVMVKFEDSKTPTLCFTVSSLSMQNMIDCYIDDSFDLDKIPVVEVETGDIHFIPINLSCEVVDKYNFTVESF